MFADADALKFQVALDICDSDQAEIGCPAADVADQHDIAVSDQVAPCSARLRRPGVECRLRFLQQCDVPETRGLGGLGGEASCHLVERGRNRHDDLALREVPIPSLRTLGVQERVPEVLQVTARAFEGRELLFRDVGPPGQDPLFRIDMRVGQPGLGGRHETIRHERATVARELADDRGLPSIVPGQRKRTFRELLAVRNIKGRWQRRHLAKLIWSHDLRDFDDLGVATLDIGDRDRAVAGAEVDTND